MSVIQSVESNCEPIKKKTKKNKKLVNGVAEDGVSKGYSDMTTDVRNNKIIHKTKSVKRKKLPNDGGFIEAGAGLSASPEAAKKKKKSVISGAVNGQKIKSEKFADVEAVMEPKGKKDCTVRINGSPTQQTDSHLKGSVDGCIDKKRKRKKRDVKSPDLINGEACVADEDEQYSKKLRIDSDGRSDKTVVSSSSVQPGAFENYRISPAMADKLQGI